MCKLHDVEIVQGFGGVFNTAQNGKGGVGGKKGYIYLSSSDFLVQFGRYDNFYSHSKFCRLTNTRRPSLFLGQQSGTL